ncbi:SMC-Scp complex subunit ScpB [Veillonella sp. R32]|uniref:SMC-Scp complex subunit ScpB n=1 Tax=Veillonella sp. R32 TaxID=2021312 RepID=UPI00138A5362|nr:SMC-Scp complex subunit ScpB [Veillonella sp. R32]KAF1679310.1 SMC-Scp complex subunit ScpB [Veillonella sp. R32]
MTDVNQPTDTSLLAHLEAVLFSAAKPVPLALLGELFNLDEAALDQVLQLYSEQLVTYQRGLRLKLSGVGAELVSAPESSAYVSQIRQREDRLSPAAMETLAVIAFKQPVTKSEIEEVRGVNCEKVLKQLVTRDLVMELGRKESIGRPVLYGTTDTFLRSVGIESVETLKQEVATQDELTVSKET